MAKENKLQTYAVLWLDSQSMDIKTICVETGLSTRQVKNILTKNKIESSTPQQNNIPINQQPVSAKSKAHNMMITESVGKRQKVSIMTKEASQLADEERKKYIDSSTKSYIFRPSTNE